MTGSMLLQDATLGRREALAALAGLGLAGTVQAAPQRGRRGGLDWADPKDNLFAFGKIWAGYDGPVIGAYHRVMYGRLPDRRLVPLFNYEGTGVLEAKINPDGSYQVKSRETGYFTDLLTREVLETWRNPFTDETVEVYHFYNDVVGGRIGLTIPDFVMSDGSSTQMNAGLNVRAADGTYPFRVPIEFYGDTAMMSWDYAHRKTNPVDPAGWPRASTGAVITPSEHFTFNVSRKLLEDRSVPQVPFTAGFTRLSEPWPFMKMGGTPFAGMTVFGRMFSHKGLKGFGEVPPKLLAYIEKNAPQYLALPDGWPVTNARLDTWTCYAMDVPPENTDFAWKCAGKERPGKNAPPPTGAGARSWR
jgi:hypothetical protein